MTKLAILTYPVTDMCQNQHIGINIGDSLITPSREPPRNLGVLFDSTCSLNDHVSKICKSINYNLYSIGKIRKYLDTPTAEKMINCSITSRLDYCNSLLYGAKGYNISQLQLCQNNAARMLSLRRKFDHITPVLKDLHWLPVEQRIEYKVLLLTYKALHGKARHISPSCCLCTLPPGPCDQRTKISSECQDAVWKGLVDAALRMLLHPFGTLSLHLLNVPLPLIPSRAVWRLIYLMWRIPRSTDSYIVWVCCLWLFLSVFYLKALLSMVTFHHFWN